MSTKTTKQGVRDLNTGGINGRRFPKPKKLSTLVARGLVGPCQHSLQTIRVQRWGLDEFGAPELQEDWASKCTWCGQVWDD